MTSGPRHHRRGDSARTTTQGLGKKPPPASCPAPPQAPPSTAASSRGRSRGSGGLCTGCVPSSLFPAKPRPGDLSCRGGQWVCEECLFLEGCLGGNARQGERDDSSCLLPA